jgi:response regulator RpfG family c-di-GMP phosphodiesterase
MVCDALVREKLLSADRVDALMGQARASAQRIEELLVELELVQETDLLKTLAASYQVHFISTEKLSKADVPRALLNMIPHRFAEQVAACPVAFDAKTHSLMVVTADPDNAEAMKELLLASGAREVRAVLARPAAVQALIAKAYGGDLQAFARLATVGGHPVGPTAFAAAPAGPAPASTGPSLLELLNVLVSLLENARPDLRGHSAQVARLARRLAEKLTLDPSATAAAVCAAYVHDLGKMGQFHLTSLNCSQYDGHRVAAQKVYDVPPRLLEPTRLPAEATQAARHMYERYDGTGFPDGLSGKNVPLAARILAIADTYADLTQNPRNPYRKTLSPNEACAVLSMHSGTVFDPNLVDLFHHTVLGEDLKARLLSTRSQALLVDTDPEETTVLELRMIEQGFVVKTARTSEQAFKALAEGETDLVVSEIDLAPSDGLELLAQARKTSWGKDLPWVVYTRRQERAVAQRALEMRVLDFINKPANAEVMVAKLKAMLDQRASARGARGVSGSLREMGLPDMVQVLFHGRKSGNLRIRAQPDPSRGPGGSRTRTEASGAAGEIHFLDGNVVYAIWGRLEGTDAFYAMLKLADGEFALDPAFQPSTRIIHESSEALLLEGMRRLDEGI